MLRKPHYIAFGLLALAGLIFLSLPESASNRVKLTLTGLFLPLFGLTESTQSVARRAGMLVGGEQLNRRKIVLHHLEEPFLARLGAGGADLQAEHDHIALAAEEIIIAGAR